jgi:aminoglycoside phosphotransferase (APT) family kinase protein
MPHARRAARRHVVIYMSAWYGCRMRRTRTRRSVASLPARPAADITVSKSLVQALLEEQHEDLAHLALVQVAEGWDNTIFRLGDELAVRLPRRAASAALIEHEQRWLPQLAARLPMATPVPLRIGVPSPLFPWSWSIVCWLPGQSLLRASLQDPVATTALLERLFLELHQPAPTDAPRNPWRGVPLAARTSTLHEHLRQIDGLVDRRAVLSLWEQALSAPPWPGPPLWLHGDLHPGNMLVNDGDLSGVVDFGDLTSGDPATDLSVLWMLPTPLRAGFKAWTGDEPDALKMRARGWALALGLAYLAHSQDEAAMAALGQRTVNSALTG